MAKWVYSFGNGTAEGRAEMRNLLGGKGANLAEMSSLGLPVPPGFTVTTDVCTYYYGNTKSYPPELRDEVDAALEGIEKTAGASFGDPNNPLLVSVRSGARASASTTAPCWGSPSRRVMSASPGTATAASSRCSPTSCSTLAITISRRRSSSRRRISASRWTPT